MTVAYGATAAAGAFAILRILIDSLQVFSDDA
jgi:hypothetical protein